MERERLVSVCKSILNHDQVEILAILPGTVHAILSVELPQDVPAEDHALRLQELMGVLTSELQAKCEVMDSTDAANESMAAWIKSLEANQAPGEKRQRTEEVVDKTGDTSSNDRGDS